MQLTKRNDGLYELKLWDNSVAAAVLTRAEVNELARLFVRQSKLLEPLFAAERAYRDCRLVEYYRHKSRLFREVENLLNELETEQEKK